jgi:GTP-binding protein HflX
MTKKQPEPTIRPRERAFLVGAEIYGQAELLTLEDSLNELELLASTAGLQVVGQATQKLDAPNPATFIGPGKVEEVKALVEETQAEVVLFDEELSPRHLRELEKIFGEKVRILDRTALILDIFAQRAHTKEGKLQVELAQLNYLLPRLTGRGTAMSRLGGGIGTRGPGETKLESDRRRLRARISDLTEELNEVRQHRGVQKAGRRRLGFR